LQEICHSFAFGTNEATGLEEFKDVVAWPMVHNLALREQHDVVEELESLRSWLQEGHDDGGVHDMAELRQALDDLVCRRAVQPGRDFVHEERLRWPHYHLTCTKPTSIPHVTNPYTPSPARNNYADLLQEGINLRANLLYQW
jgi:hypothetical protein